MEHKRTERLTKSAIECDIKSLYTYNIKSSILAVLFMYFGLVVLWFACDLSKKSNWDLVIIVSFTIYTILTLCLTAYLIYLIKQYFQKDMKYTIVTDTFIKTGRKHGICYGIFGMPCMCFSKYGKFILHFYRDYYKWSDLYSGMDDDRIINCSTPGDKFYLIINKNEKILSVYNTKLFELVN